MAILAIYKFYSNGSTAKYMLNIPLVLYSLIFLIKYKFAYKVVERVAVLLQDAAIIACYNIFVIKYQYVPYNNLDFYALALVLLLEFIFLLPKLVKFFKNEEEDDSSAVNPEKELKQVAHNGAGKKRQEFAEADYMPNDSFSGLRSSSNVYINQSPKPPQRSPPPKRR
jgi:hypothetical protein